MGGTHPFQFIRTVVAAHHTSHGFSWTGHQTLFKPAVFHTGNLERPDIQYDGPVITDYYGRNVPKPAHGSVDLNGHTSSSEYIIKAATRLFNRIANPDLTIRRLSVTAQNVIHETDAQPRQLDLFGENAPTDGRERRRQEAVLAIRDKYGKNSILRGMNFEEGSTARERNKQVGGHKA